MNIFLDIETIPAQDADVIALLREEAEQEKAAIAAPSNYKDPEKIASYIAEKTASIDLAFGERYRKTSLDGAYGQIVCAGVAIDDDAPQVFWQPDWQNGESAILRALFDYIGSVTRPGNLPTYIGHNVANFDLRFIWQRAAIHGIAPPLRFPITLSPWDDRVYDTMFEWAGRGQYVSLNKLCRVFGLPGKGDMDGSKVWDYVQDGRILDVVDYCKQDVARVREIYRRMSFEDSQFATPESEIDPGVISDSAQEPELALA